MSAPNRVVILGGGFAGVYTAKAVFAEARRQRADLEVHLISRDNYMVFQPMLPEVLSGGVGLADTISPIRRLVPKAIVHVREVEKVDLEAREVVCSPGLRPKQLMLPFDHLVVALGNVSDFRGLTGIAEHAFRFKSLADAIRLRNHVIHVLEEADSEMDDEARQALLTFVVAGGGFSGVEVLAELNDYVTRSLASFPRIHRSDCKFILLHSRDRILPELDSSLADYAHKLLEKRGVKIWLGKRLASATPSHAILNDGTSIATMTLVSTVPSTPNPVVLDILSQLNAKVGGERSTPESSGRLIVDKSMLVQGTDYLWSVGDCAQVPMPTPKGAKPDFAPPTAQHAIREAAICGANIVRKASGTPLKSFNFSGLGSMAVLGGHRGVAQVFGYKITGIPGWLAWRAVYLAKLPGLDRKARVGLSWLYNLLFSPDLAQIRLSSLRGILQEHYETGQAIFEEGDVGDRVYIILKGCADVYRTLPGDNQQSHVGTLEAGQYFGVVALMRRQPRSATIRCREPMDLLAIPREDFDILMSSGALQEFFSKSAQPAGDEQLRESVPPGIPVDPSTITHNSVRTKEQIQQQM